MAETTDSLRSEIDALREKIAEEKIQISIREAQATQEWRDARLVAERDVLRAELEAMGVTGGSVAPPAAVDSAVAAKAEADAAAAKAAAEAAAAAATEPRADKR